MKRFLLVILASLPLILLGCSSAQRQYERGMELEVQGDFAGAARYYAEAIRKDPQLNRMLPGRLRESGRQAVELYVADARALETNGQWPDAADRYLDADAILALGRSVGVDVPAPRRYREDRRATFDGAIGALLEYGWTDHEWGNSVASLQRFERARKYEPTPEQAAELREATATVRLAWASWLLDAGRFRQAFDVAEAGLATRSRHDLAFRQVQYDALAAGTLRLAALPLQRMGGTDTGRPSNFPQDLTLLLEDDFWSRPPLFVQIADPRDVRTVVRRRVGRDILLGNPRLTARLGQDLDADFAAAGGIERFTRTTGEERRAERTVRLRRGGGSDTYTEIRIPTTFRAAVRFEVVDVRTRRVICSDRVERSAQGNVLSGEYSGDPRQLNLSSAQRELFTVAGYEAQERRIQERLAEQLAEALSKRVYSCVLARVP
jgi:hypothetical protein